MSSIRTSSPACPRCENHNTYDIIPELAALHASKSSTDPLETAYSYGNKKYYCVDCGHIWKKYTDRISYEKIKSIKAEAGGFPGPFFTVKIDLEASTVESNPLMKYRFENKEISSSLTLNDIAWFREELYNCDFMNWAERYEDLFRLGGSHWSIQIEYDSHSEQKNGFNHFPPEWERFCKAVTKVARKEFFLTYGLMEC